MTDKRITDLDALTSPDSNDFLVAVDTSDTTSSPEGTTKKITISDLFNKINFFGWANYADSQYTALAPRSILSGARTQLTNNTGGASTNTTYLNENQELWDNDAIRPIAIGDAFDVRVTFSLTAETNDKDVTLEMDIGSGTPIIIYSETRRMLKSGGAVNSFAFSIPTYSLDTFLANGGKLYITPTSNIQLYGLNIFIVKTFRNIS